MSFRHRMWFDAVSGEGWSETYYNTLDATYTAAAVTGNQLEILRLGLLTSDFNLIYSSVEDIATPRAVLPVQPRYPNSGSYVPVVSPAIRFPTIIAILLRFISSGHKSNHKFLHGVGNWQAVGETYAPEPPWDTALHAYITYLKLKYGVATGFVHGIPASVTDISDVLVMGVKEHKVGRPFGAEVGRRLIRV